MLLVDTVAMEGQSRPHINWNHFQPPIKDCLGVADPEGGIEERG